MSKLESLNAQLKEAIEKEEYEKAARLRDEIRKLAPDN
jgi:protein-arginine kinase activator protein McsA